MKQIPLKTEKYWNGKIENDYERWRQLQLRGKSTPQKVLWQIKQWIPSVLVVVGIVIVKILENKGVLPPQS